ncbi:MAG: hypothetical protein ACI3XJ_05430 [Oscillospiraceae bacterium]
MKKNSKRIAVCGVTAALGVVIMLLGAVLGIGMYLAPMLVGACLIPIGKEWGAKYQILLWIAISLLCLMLVSDPEENLMFLGLFGWYPILRPTLQKLPPVLRVVVKLLIFNVVVIALELLLLLVLVPESMGAAWTALLLALGNVTFLIYDFVIPRFELLAAKYLKRIFRL